MGLIPDETLKLSDEDKSADPRARIRLAELEDGDWTWATGFHHTSGSVTGSSSPIIHPDENEKYDNGRENRREPTREAAIHAGTEALIRRQRRMIENAAGLWNDAQEKDARRIIQWCFSVRQRGLFGQEE